MTSVLAEPVQTAPKLTRVSVELVPRSRTSLRTELAELSSTLGNVQVVNIPDFLRYRMRSWEGCQMAREHVPEAIPHIRAIDINPREPLKMADFLREHGLSEVLIIEGDAPSDMSQRTYDVTSLDIIRKFRRELPEVSVWAGLDPYRQSFTRERDYAEAKLEAGAIGFFTQPFFDRRLMDIWAELLPTRQVFWGATSVTTERSFSYWQNRNKAVFPSSFTPTLEANRAWAQEVLNFAAEVGGHTYFMPIKESLSEYLGGIL
ncbi:methylenetetrahydrofolate reductase [Deinococcus psychrotolerans]|uniref:methylenetetrahydrofolate reductase n=1 Tax=Deinococcus psychrotolerans TaxID=2489213 RepID=UPI001F14C4FE|nr:methylenetetrahydrofolate reductase [Deinococcus psychrotolerans]